MGKIKFLFISFVIIIFFTSCQNNTKIQQQEESNDDIVVICMELLGSDRYEEKIKYFPEMLYTNFDFSSIKKFDRIISEEESFYNQMQTEYLLSYLYLNQLEKFKQQYVKHYFNYRGTGLDERTMDFCFVACSDVSIEQRDAIISAFELTAKKLSENTGNEKNLLGIYNLLSIIYNRYGETDKSEYYSQKSESIIESLKKNVKIN